MITSYIIFHKALVTPSSNPPYPSLMRPYSPLLHVRLINVAIQAFSQLFVYTGSGSRGRMIEVVLSGMSGREKMTTEAKQICAHNILCILWCVVDVRFSLYSMFLMSRPQSSSISIWSRIPGAAPRDRSCSLR